MRFFLLLIYFVGGGCVGLILYMVDVVCWLAVGSVRVLIDLLDAVDSVCILEMIRVSFFPSCMRLLILTHRRPSRQGGLAKDTVFLWQLYRGARCSLPSPQPTLRTRTAARP